MRNILEKHPGLDSVYLLVAQGGVFERPTLVQTVLGSCVSVVFFAREVGIGGMFHALLPKSADYEKGMVAPGNRYRYVDAAVDALVMSLKRRKVDPGMVECKVFGGAGAMFQGETAVGIKNVQSAYESLARHQLRVAASHVGGDRGRKLVFLSHTGEVFVKCLRQPEAVLKQRENARRAAGAE